MQKTEKGLVLLYLCTSAVNNEREMTARHFSVLLSWAVLQNHMVTGRNEKKLHCLE